MKQEFLLVNKKKPKLTFVDRQKVLRRFLGLTVITWSIILGSVLGVSAILYVISSFQGSFLITPGGTLTSNLPTSVSATAGSNYSYTFVASNVANRGLNYTVALNLSEASLETNEARLQILNSTGSVMASTTTATANVMSVAWNDIYLLPGQSVNGSITLDFSLGADNSTYNATLGLTPGSNGWS